MKHNREQKGFSLIELLIVIAIIGIVAAIAVPSLVAARAAAQQGAAVAVLRTIHSTQMNYCVSNGRYARLTELNAFNNGNLGEIAGPTLRRQGYVFQMIPTAPTNAQLVQTFTIAASATAPNGTLVIFTVDQEGVINQLSP